MKRKPHLDLLYDFYPKSIDSINSPFEYLNSNEYKNLIKLIEGHKKKITPLWVKAFFDKVEKIDSDLKFEDVSLFNWNDRCYTLELMKNLDNKIYLLRFYKSILTPYYIIMCFQVKMIDNEQKSTLISKDDFFNKNLIDELSILAKENEFIEFDNEILFKPIGDVNFEDIPMGGFNFFNAFFSNQII